MLQRNGLFGYFLILLFLSNSSGEMDLIGNLIVSDSALVMRSHSGIFLLENIMLPERAAILKFKCYVVGPEVVWFQLWRPESSAEKNFTLIQQIRFASEQYPQIVNVEVPMEEPMIADAGDVIALFHETEVVPLSYRFEPNSDTFYYTVLNGTALQPGVTVTFEDLPYPYEFSVQVYYDADFEKYLPTHETEETTESEVIVTTTSTVHSFTETFINIRDIFLIPNERFGEGVLIRFHATLLETSSVYFQVWRPLTNETYRLIGQYHYTRETRIRGPIEISLDENEYITLEEGDVLGFTCLNSYGCIQYKPTDNPEKFGAKIKILTDEEIPNTGDVFEFDSHMYPHDYDITATYIKGEDSASIPNHSETTLPETPLTSSISAETVFMTSSNVDPGIYHILGEEYMSDLAIKTFQNGGQRTVMVGGLEFAADAQITGFQVAVVASGPVYLQIWRRNGTTNGRFGFNLVEQRLFEFEATNELIQEARLQADDTFITEGGDVLGFTNPTDICVIGYEFTASRIQELYFSVDGARLDIGSDSMFERLSFPYQFGVAVMYLPIEVEETTAADVGESTESSSHLTADNSVPSDHEPRPYATKKCAKDDEWFNNKGLVLGLLIWLIVLTLAFISLLVYVIYLFRKKDTMWPHQLTGKYKYRASTSNTTAPPRAYHSPEYQLSSEYLHFAPAQTGPSRQNQNQDQEEMLQAEGDNNRMKAACSNPKQRTGGSAGEPQDNTGDGQVRMNPCGQDSDSAYENSLTGNTNEAADIEDIDVYDLVYSKL